MPMGGSTEGCSLLTVDFECFIFNILVFNGRQHRLRLLSFGSTIYDWVLNSAWIDWSLVSCLHLTIIDYILTLETNVWTGLAWNHEADVSISDDITRHWLILCFLFHTCAFQRAGSWFMLRWTKEQRQMMWHQPMTSPPSGHYGHPQPDEVIPTQTSCAHLECMCKRQTNLNTRLSLIQGFM